MVIFWRISNSRRILRRELLNIRRELLDSLREFSYSRRNLDENCWIRGENPVKSRQPNCIILSLEDDDIDDHNLDMMLLMIMPTCLIFILMIMMMYNLVLLWKLWRFLGNKV